MKKWILGAGVTILLGGGGILVADFVDTDVVATLNDPITLGEAMKFRAPSHSIEVRDNGQIDIIVGGEKHYGITPSKAAEKNKAVFLDIEQGKELKMKNAFGIGSEITLINTSRSFSKIVSLTEDFLKDVPKDAEYVEVSFDLSGWNLPDGVYAERIQLQQDVWLEKSLAWDSTPSVPATDTEEEIPNGNYTDIDIEIKDGVLTKKIPVAWLKTAQFPIYTDATFTFGTKELVDVAPSNVIDVVSIGTDKAAICWVDGTDTSAEGRCLVATVSGTDLTFGSASNYSADVGAAIAGNNNHASVCGAGTDRWVVVFTDDADADDGTARVASSTGTTVNGYGTAFDYLGGARSVAPSCTYISTDTILVAYSHDAVGDISARACTISATYTLSCGTEVDLFDMADGIVGLDTICVTLDTNKFICQQNDDFIVGTVSGTTITLGTSIQFNNGTTDTLGHSLITPTTDKFSYIYTGTSGASPISMGLGTVSGTTITLGATSTLMATTTSFSALTAIDADSALFMGQWGGADAATTFLAAVPIELNFSTLTFSTSTAETVDATTDPGSLHAAKISDCKFLFAWEDDNDTNDLFALVGDTLGCAVQRFQQDIFWYE